MVVIITHMVYSAKMPSHTYQSTMLLSFCQFDTKMDMTKKREYTCIGLVCGNIFLIAV